MPEFNIKDQGFKEMWSMYLFNKLNAPKDDNLLSESLIRNNELVANDKGAFVETKPGDKINISSIDFMADGNPGGLVKGACFKVIRNFFPETQTFIVNGQTVTKQTGLTDEHLRNHNLGTVKSI